MTQVINNPAGWFVTGMRRQRAPPGDRREGASRSATDVGSKLDLRDYSKSNTQCDMSSAVCHFAEQSALKGNILML